MQAPLVDVHTHGTGTSGAVCIISADAVGYEPDVYGDGWFAMGVHPWRTGTCDLEEQLERVERESLHPRVAAIGECGLDRLRGAALAVQVQVFVRHIRLAERLRKPLIVHCVRAFSELVGLKRKYRVSVPMIVHGFNVRERVGAQLLAEGFWLSFGSALLDARGAAAVMLRRVPVDRFFLETDDAAIGIQDVYEAAAALRGAPLDELRSSLWNSFLRVFPHGR